MNTIEAARQVTVFGGTGFLGGAVARRLVADGVTVRVCARKPRSSEAEFHPADILDESAVATAVAGASGVVNAVSLYAEPRRGPTFEDIHVDGAERLARLARAAGVRDLVHISGIGADAHSPSKYIRARALGEARVRDAFPDAVILRPSVLFGRGDAFVSTLTGIVRALPVVPLFGRGATRLQPVHVEDVAAAVAAVLANPAFRGRVLELGGETIHSYREILQMIAARERRRRLLLPIPFPVWHVLARIASMLPGAPITVDQVVLMEADNVVGPGAGRFADLGIQPRGLRDAL